jgi:hypothetical protein
MNAASWIADHPRLEVNFGGNHAVSATVGDPKGRYARIVIDMPEHVVVLLAPVDEFDGQDNLLGGDGEELEYGAVLAPDDDTAVDESQGRRGFVTADPVSRRSSYRGCSTGSAWSPLTRRPTQGGAHQSQM